MQARARQAMWEHIGGARGLVAREDSMHQQDLLAYHAAVYHTDPAMSFAVRETLEACIEAAPRSVRAVECAANLAAEDDARQYAVYLYDKLPAEAKVQVDPATVAKLTGAPTEHVWVGMPRPPLALHALSLALRAYTTPLPPRDAACYRLNVVTDDKHLDAYDPRHICRYGLPVIHVP